MNIEGTVAFITGASSGIGAALAREFARLGADVVAAARRIDRLEELVDDIESVGRRALAVRCDVTADGDLERAVAEALDGFGRIDWAVANAGFGVAAGLSKLELDDFRRQFETNVYGVLRTAYAVRDPLIDSGGCFAIMGSAAGYLGMPGTSPYSMSKAAVHSLASSLRYEWAPRGVSVTLLAPGFVSSEIRQVDNRGVLHPEAADHIPRWLVMPADVAARKMVRAIVKRRREVVITAHGRLAVALRRHTPGLLAALVGRFGTRRLARGKPPG